MITINEVVNNMKELGYRITPRTVKYYIDRELLPKPIKRGRYKEGVQLYFDKEEVLSRLSKIYELKAKGFKLSEISMELKDLVKLRSEFKRKRFLKRIIKRKNQYFHVLKDEPTKPFSENYERWWIDNLKNIFEDPEMSEFYLFNKTFDKNDTDEVLNRGLYRISYLYNEKPVFWDSEIWEAFAYIELFREDGIDWKTLEALYKQHEKNFDHYFGRPEPDNFRHTKNSICWERQIALNSFGKMVKQYLNENIYKTSTRGTLRPMELVTPWDYEYRDTDLFIQEFLNGNCAFVPSYNYDVRYFLKKIRK